MRDRLFWWETPTKQYGTQTITERTYVPFDVELDDIHFNGVGENTREVNGYFLLRSQNGGYTDLPPNLNILITMVFTNPQTSYQETKQFYINTDDCELDENGYIVGSATFSEIYLYEYYFDFGDIQYEYDYEQPYYETTTTTSLVPNGDIQFGEEGFNSGFTVDGTKDSCKVAIYSLTQKSSIKPFSIAWHENTNTWWIVSSDRVERLENEQGYIYKHNLQLEGAIELLNARDLTDCGFNQNTYTIEQFTKRLFELSNFEFKGNNVNIIVGNNMDIAEAIDYVKTYENYTLLSAIRDFFDGYNCAAKLTFNKDSSNNLTGCNLNICPKNGNIDLPVLDLDSDFNEKTEQRRIHKNSYGTTVVSNTDNVVSTITKVFPSVGGVKLSSNQYNVTNTNAVIKLPTKAFNVQEVKMMLNVRLGVRVYESGSWHYHFLSEDYYGYFNVSDEISLDRAISKCRTTMSQEYRLPTNQFDSKRASIKRMIQKMGSITFNGQVTYDPQSRLFVQTGNERIRRTLQTYGSATRYWVQTVVADKETANAIADIGTPSSGATYSRPANVFHWERGSDEISGFNFFPCDIRLTESDYGKDDCVLFSWNWGSVPVQFIVDCGETTSNYEIYANPFGTNVNQPHKVLWSVKYVPMTDLKIKLDNRGDDNNTHLYNQNGKLTDINAFSKMLNSYKQEIEGENITRYAFGYDMNEMPQVGQIVNGDGHKYVINSVSFNFTQNEESNGGAYYIAGQYSLSEYAAVKSLLTSPNTNVRDYGIPQKNNIARKQVYRDFYELTFTLEHNENDYYQPLSNILDFGNTATENYTSHSAIFKLTYDEEVNGHTEYYYTLESTVFKMKKAVYEVIEFKDNNIIGYDAQNTNTGFSISRVFTGTYELMNVPISYTDSKGRFKGIDINFCNSNQLGNIYRTYKNTTQYSTIAIPFQNYLLFLPQEIYDLACEDNRHDFKITDLTFNKDALEVPVFEYCCQIDDTPDVEIGQDIIENEDSMVVVYDFVVVDKNTATQLNAKKFFNRLEYAGDIYSDPQVVYDSLMELYSRDAKISIESDNKTIKIKFYYYQTLTYLFNQQQTAIHLESISDSSQVPVADLKDKDIIIYKHLVKSISYDPIEDESYCEYNDKLVMIIHGPTEEQFDNGDLVLKINHYKLN